MFDFPASPTIGQIISGPGGYPCQWDGTRWTPAAFAQQPLGATGSLSTRNYIHNPTFRIWQRGAGVFGGSGAYTADRWLLQAVTDTMNAAQYAMPDIDRRIFGDEQARLALQITFTGTAGAGAYSYITQRMENLWRFSNKTVIVSFWATNGGSGTTQIGVNMLNYFGTGGSPTTNYWMTPQLLPIQNRWTRYSAIFKMPTSAGVTWGTNLDSMLGLAIICSSGSGNAAFAGTLPTQSGALYLWGVQVEIAQPGQTQPSPLDVPDMMTDLDECRRFYQIGQFETAGYQGIAGNGQGYTHPFSPTMRAIPTMGSSSVTQTNCTGSLSRVTADSFAPYASATAIGSMIYAGQWTASADI